jgi:putative FmdB family regulatory protein
VEANVPTYSYACTACEHQFDTVQKFTDPSLTDCPECAGRLRKLFSSVGIVFKGSGFYRTDSRAANSEKPSSNGKSESGAPDKGHDKQSDKQSDKPKTKTSESKSSSDPKKASSTAA